jgi:tricorn protease
MAHAGYIRFPTIHGDQIVFTAEDDLWLVGLDGGRAERLTAGIAEITNARFSPDGKTLAFIGQTEGPDEVYVMPVEGGEARRLTFNSARARIAAWRPDGSAIIFSTSAAQPVRGWQSLYEVSADGGLSRPLPWGPAHSIAFGPNGAVVLGRNTGDPATWKRYRGGTAGYLWIDRDGSGEFARLLDLKSNIANPCWAGDRVYFISDHEGIGNIYSCLPSGEDVRRHSDQRDYYARGLATDGKTLVYHAGGDLYTATPDGKTGRKLDVTLTGTRTHTARKFAPAGRWLENFATNPRGDRVALTARGKLFTLGAFEGAVSQHGDPEATRYRLVTWLADGKRVAAVADTGEEPRLAVFTAGDPASARVFDELDIGHVMDLAAAPVGSLVAFSNHRGDFAVVDAESGATRILDHTDHGREEDAMHQRGLAWSADGQWLAYSYAINGRQTAIKVANVASGQTAQVTEPLRYDMSPAFDPEGKYLYFLSARDFDPVQDQMLFEWSFPRGVRPYLVTLKREMRSPFSPLPPSPEDETKSDKPEVAADGVGEAKNGKDASDGAEKQPADDAPKPVEIDLDGISARIVRFPVPEGRYARIAGIPGGAVFTSLPVEGTLNESWTSLTPPSNGSLAVYRFESAKLDQLTGEISEFAVTPGGKQLIYRSHERLRVMRAGEKPIEGPEGDQPGRVSGWLDLDRVKVGVWPAAEWRQMYREAWRLQREQYWTADMSGIDWQTVRERYEPLLARVGSRAELSDLMWEMQGELGSSHAYEFGGEYRERPHYSQGSLGCDWDFDAASGEYTITHIVRGDPWAPDATSPLLAPGVNVGAGDAILAINGQSVTRERSPQSLLVNQAGTEVELQVRPKDGGEPRAVTVRALPGGDFLGRYVDWVEANRRQVHERSNGRVGYLHVPDMGSFGFAIFHRYYLQEYDYEGLIVDVRWNGGGSVSGLVLEKLLRPRLGYDFQRWSGPSPYFIESPRGSIVGITDENAGSDGDIFSQAFKMLKLGPLVGKRTWGGVVGISPYIALADGTLTTQPEFAFWFNDVGWAVENYGVDPTIDVDNAPQDYARGADPQLERALAEALRLVDERPSRTPDPGPRPHKPLPHVKPREAATPVKASEAETVETTD